MSVPRIQTTHFGALVDFCFTNFLDFNYDGCATMGASARAGVWRVRIERGSKVEAKKRRRCRRARKGNQMKSG